MAAGNEVRYTLQGTGGLSRPRVELRISPTGPVIWYKERHLDDGDGGSHDAEIVAVVKVQSCSVRSVITRI
jgi:hypothetical protein